MHSHLAVVLNKSIIYRIIKRVIFFYLQMLQRNLDLIFSVKRKFRRLLD